MNDIYPLTKHIKETTACIDAALDNWTLGNLVIEDSQAYLQLKDGSLIPVPADAVLEVKNGDLWTPVSAEMLQARTREGWPAYAGLLARMKERR